MVASATVEGGTVPSVYGRQCLVGASVRWSIGPSAVSACLDCKYACRALMAELRDLVVRERERQHATMSVHSDSGGGCSHDRWEHATYEGHTAPGRGGRPHAAPQRRHSAFWRARGCLSGGGEGGAYRVKCTFGACRHHRRPAIPGGEDGVHFVPPPLPPIRLGGSPIRGPDDPHRPSHVELYGSARVGGDHACCLGDGRPGIPACPTPPPCQSVAARYMRQRAHVCAVACGGGAWARPGHQSQPP